MPKHERFHLKLPHVGVIAAISAASLFWGWMAVPTEVEILEPPVITAAHVFPAPITNDHTIFKSPPLEYAKELQSFREGLHLLRRTPLTVEEQIIEDAKPILYLGPTRRPPAPQAPAYIDSLLTTYFHDAVGLDWARRVGKCESGWDANAKNPRSTAAGLFQFLRSTWDWVASQLGLGNYDSGAVYDPESNVTAAAWLYYNEGPSHWVCK